MNPGLPANMQHQHPHPSNGYFPQYYHQHTNHYPAAALAGQAMYTALANPHAGASVGVTQEMQGGYVSNHYAQAYIMNMRHAQAAAAMNAAASTFAPRLTTPDGYTLSSTYNPQSSTSTFNSNSNSQVAWQSHPSLALTDAQNAESPHSKGVEKLNRSGNGGNSFRECGFGVVPKAFTSLGPGGPLKCTYGGCKYSSTLKKDVVVHMMDRHLIYPPSWEDKKKKKRSAGGGGDDHTEVFACYCCSCPCNSSLMVIVLVISFGL
jgi:hypothetical protein